MRVQEIIRAVLDIIDQADEIKNQEPTMSVQINAEPAHDDIRRIQQIAGLIDREEKEFANEPAEKYADVSAVTTAAGGGVNGPKHPADIRGEHPSMYPYHQHKPGI